MSFGEKLRKLREARGLSQEELANMMNKLCTSQLKRNTISNYERGISFPDYQKLTTLVKILDTTSDNLLGISKRPQKSRLGQKTLGTAANEKVVEATFRKESADSFSKNSRDSSPVISEVKYISTKEHYFYAKNSSNLAYIATLPTIKLPYNNEKQLRAFQLPSDMEHLFANMIIKYGDVLIGERNELATIDENVLCYITVWKDQGVKLLKKFELKKALNNSEMLEVWTLKAVITYDETYDHSHNL